MKIKTVSFLQSLLLVAPVSLLAYFFTQQSINSNAHHERVATLIEIKSLDAKLDAAVLEMLNSELIQFDSLAKLNQTVEKIKGDAYTPFIDTNLVVNEKLQVYIKLIEQKAQKVESIKTSATNIRNSLLYLPQLVAEIAQQDPQQALVANQLLNQLLLNRSHLLSNDPLINQQTTTSKLWTTFLQHLEVAQQLSMDLDDTKHKFLQILSDATFKELNDAYHQFHTEQINQEKSLSQTLLITAMALFALLVFILHRLHTAKDHAINAGKTLDDAVARLTEGVAVFNSRGKLMLSNKSWRQHFGYDENTPLPQSLSAWQQTHQEALSLNKELHRTSAGTWLQVKTVDMHDGGKVFVSVNVTLFKKAEEDLRKWGYAIEQSPASIIITDPRARIEYVNPKFEKVTGYSLAEIKGKTPSILGGKPALSNYKNLLKAVRRGEVWRGEFYNKRKSGEHYWEFASISPIKNKQGDITNFIAINEDITAQKKINAQLKTASAVFNATQEGIMTTNANLEITAVNPAFTDITGYEPHEVLGKKPNMLSSGKHDKHFYEQMWTTLKSQGKWAAEIWNKHKDGSVYPEWLAISVVYDEHGEVQQYVAILSDMTERKAQEEQIEYQAYYDALTGLPNRTLLLERIEQDIRRLSRTEHVSAVLFIDLDRFKRINDTMGHEAGDILLIEVAKRLSNIIRQSDTLSRFGGDEFVLLLTQITHADHAAQVAEKIISALNQPFSINGFEMFIGASIGIAVLPNDARDHKELLRLADLAMYKAKDSGRNQFHFFAQEMQLYVNRRVELEQQLRLALEHNQLTIYYQPIVDIETETLYGVEALMRWPIDFDHYISPEEFIPVAEESGLIAQLGEWMLAEACSQIRTLNAALGINCYLSVNLSSQQYRLGFNATTIKQAMRTSGFKAENLTLEITESILLEDDNEIKSWLHSLKATGLQLAIDDFGTGYSSLSYLKRFPIDTLKIDRSFIQDIAHNQDAEVLTKAIHSMANSLALKVIAEGVEEAEQLQALQKLGCQYVQGFYYAKPMAYESLKQWVETYTFSDNSKAHSLWLD
ncbi:EAL domain-containing protein (plasmid) [Pseudoalteromonas sp. T1lg65]|uniref:EAL domain-containing protein n=1 Tax=Pseudoalteromonas sp. T1lg65 TaxID=2077101 RepID=UPI003F7ABF75